MLASGEFDRFGDAGPQRAAGRVLGEKTISLDKPVAVERLSVTKTDDVQHAVTVEGVIRLERRMQGILGVAQVDPVQVGRDLAGNHHQIVGVPFAGLRTPRPGAVGVVVTLGQRGQIFGHDGVGFQVHRTSRVVPMTKLTVVAVLPPKFKVPNVFAPST